MTDSSSQKAYQVLARKYRPATFEDMIGQDAMVTTLTNAFRAGRIAHAFMLTGVRGIGKTTTARLLARALNYESDKVHGPSVELAVPGEHCEAIMTSSHMDVLEMDAASRTGVENMRELLDGVRYAPVSARYKVYIIDEVHMLSTGAFNALLKTLEEPPDHAKFIFATTEIRKVPVTVLSRCQRFDLRRVDAGLLQNHLLGICEKEKVEIAPEGLALIARAAEGSVRDALSLLDQAIVQGGLKGGTVSSDQIQAMLGLADRGRIIDLFAMISAGDMAGAILELKSQYDDGADPAVVIRDLLDVCHEVTRAATLGKEAEFDAASDQAAQLKKLASDLSLGQLTRFWQMLLKAYDDVRRAPAPLAAAEMALLNLGVAGQLPPPELAAQLIKALQDGSGLTDLPGSGTVKVEGAPDASAKSEISSSKSKAPLSKSSVSKTTSSLSSVSTSSAAAPAAKPKVEPDLAPQLQQRLDGLGHLQLISLEDYVQKLPETMIDLRYDVEKYIRLIRFRSGAITIEKLTEAPPSLIGRMVESLRDMTGQLWLIEQEKGPGAPSMSEARRAALAARDAQEKAHPAFSHPLFKDATHIDTYDIAPTSNPTSNVIQAEFGTANIAGTSTDNTNIDSKGEKD